MGFGRVKARGRGGGRVGIPVVIWAAQDRARQGDPGIKHGILYDYKNLRYGHMLTFPGNMGPSPLHITLRWSTSHYKGSRRRLFSLTIQSRARRYFHHLMFENEFPLKGFSNLFSKVKTQHI